MMSQDDQLSLSFKPIDTDRNNVQGIQICVAGWHCTSASYFRTDNRYVKITGLKDLQIHEFYAGKGVRDILKIDKDEKTVITGKFFSKPEKDMATCEFTISQIVTKSNDPRNELISRRRNIHISEHNEDDLQDIFMDVLDKHYLYQGDVFNLIIDNKYYDIRVNGMTMVVLNDNQEAVSKPIKHGCVVSGTIFSFKSQDMIIKKGQSHFRRKLLSETWDGTSMGVGGLNEQFATIFRRAFASRLLSIRDQEKMGITHVRGLLLYGSPGCGKTLIAKVINSLLSDIQEPKIVSGPELLSRYVGDTEAGIRAIFADAEIDYKKNGKRANLHVIVFDEIDSIAPRRGGSDTKLKDTAVNQLLTKIDGVNDLPNILVIGTTNRKDLIDPALLRPGRLEISMFIPLPTEEGRLDILKIHTKTMADNKCLAEDVDLKKLAHETTNYSGAEIAGLVRAAQSYAVSEYLQVDKGHIELKTDESPIVSQKHFEEAITDVKPVFGSDEDKLNFNVRHGMKYYDAYFEHEMEEALKVIRAFMEKDVTSDSQVIHVRGTQSSGRTAVASYLALESKAPLIRFLDGMDFMGKSSRQTIEKIQSVFEEAYQSKRSVVIIDDIEVPLKIRKTDYDNEVFYTLQTYLKRVPYEDSKVLIIITSLYNCERGKELAYTDTLSEICPKNTHKFQCSLYDAKMSFSGN